jgi:hypothetical protein
MKYRITLALVTLLVCADARLSASQPPSPVPNVASLDTSAAMNAAARIGARDLFSGKNAKVITLKGMPLRTAALATALGARPASANDAVTCSATLVNCHIPSKAEIMTVDVPKFVGDSAYVNVDVKAETGMKRIPISYRQHTYLLVKKDGGWVVKEIAMISRT